MRRLVVGLICLVLLAPCASGLSISAIDSAADEIKTALPSAFEGTISAIEETTGIEMGKQNSSYAGENPEESPENSALPVSDAVEFVDTAVEYVVGIAEGAFVFVTGVAKSLLLTIGLFEEPVEAENLVANTRPHIQPAVAGASLLAIIGAALGTIFSTISKFAIAPLYGVTQHGGIDNENRRHIYDIIKTNPGMCIKDIARESGMGWGTVVYHISRLKRDNMIVISLNGKHRYLFENGGRYRQEERLLMAAAKNETTAKVIEFIRGNPGATQREIGTALGCSSALVSWHVSKLEQAGMVTKERIGKTVEHKFIGPDY